MPCLKRDEACWCTEAFISKRSTIFNCESVRLPNAWLWSIGKSFGWVQLFDYWTQLKSIEQIGVQLGSIDYTEMYSSMRFQLKKLENLWSYNGLFPTHQGQVIHKIFGNVTFKNLLVRWILHNIYTVVKFFISGNFFSIVFGYGNISANKFETKEKQNISSNMILLCIVGIQSSLS